jgi:hypothetical protein
MISTLIGQRKEGGASLFLKSSTSAHGTLKMSALNTTPRTTHYRTHAHRTHCRTQDAGQTHFGVGELGVMPAERHSAQTRAWSHTYLLPALLPALRTDQHIARTRGHTPTRTRGHTPTCCSSLRTSPPCPDQTPCKGISPRSPRSFALATQTRVLT